jgi:hypothetical protein
VSRHTRVAARRHPPPHSSDQRPPESLPVDADLMRAMIVMLLVGVLMSIFVALTDDRAAAPERADSATIQVLWSVGEV